MALNKIDFNKRQRYVKFLKDVFDVDLNAYSDDEFYVIYNQLNKQLDQIIEDEIKKNDELAVELQERQKDFLELVNKYSESLDLHN